MKKFYLATLTLLFFTVGFSQSPITTVDRNNIVGPTATGNAASVSSVGLTRGSGVNLSASSPTDFTSRDWDGTDQASAEAANEYIEWSVSATTNFEVTVNEFDIRLRRHGNGPSQWQIFYSLDNFATAGTAISVPQTMPATSSFEFNFSGLAITSPTSGTITFRLYAWDANSIGGWLRVTGQPAWAGSLGIADPGIRIIGSTSTSATNSIESDIIATAFDPTDNINYNAFNATSGLTTTNAIQLGEFSIRDGGATAPDSDSDGTNVTDIQFAISNNQYLAALAIFDGTTNIAETSSVDPLTSFSGLTALIANDDATKNFAVYATFNSVVTDNEQIQITVDLATTAATGSSLFALADAGGAATPVTGDNNRIEVTASKIVFDEQVSDSNQFETMFPYPTVLVQDNNDNLDLDYSEVLTVITSAGTLVGSPIDYSFVNGEAVLNTIEYSDQNTAINLFTFSNGFFTFSDPFDVNGPLINLAIQDFDGSSPEWTFTNDTPFFDNGWGTDGYYGLIDAADIAPLDFEFLSGNILGENDLNDEGNGAVGFATVTFDTVDVSVYTNVQITFDWDIEGYVQNNSDVYYRLILDGVSQPIVYLVDGNGPIDSDEGSVLINIPDATNTVGLELSIRNNLLTGFSGFDNFRVASIFEGLIYYDADGWVNNEAPSPTTGALDALVIDGSYTVDSNVEINNFIVNPGAQVQVPIAQSMTVNSELVNNGNFELNSVSTTYSSLIASSVEGEIVYNRHVNQFAPSGSTTGFNDLIAAPVTNSDQTFLDLRTANPDIPSGTIGGVPSFLFGPFDNNANAYINYTNADDTSIITAGIGYRTASTAPTGSTFRFEGNVETTTNIVPITVGTNSDFNLIGNPYPSYIKLADFLTANNTEFNPLNSGVYGYDGDNSDGFTIWNQAYSDANPTALIAPGQGFFVSSKAGGGSITFNAPMRSIGTNDDFIPGRIVNPNLAHLRLQLSNESSLYNTDFYFNDNASLSMDSGYDAVMFNGNTPDFAMYSHLVDNNVGNNLAVQAVHYNALNNVVIPLGVNANEGEQLTISILDTDIPSNFDIYLEDTVTNTFTLLNTSNYVFTPNVTLSGTGRFFLRISAEALSTSEEDFSSIQIYTTKTPRTLFIKGELNNETKAEIYDIQGRMILSTKLDSRSNNNQIDISNVTSGVYIVQLNNSTQQKSQKVIIR
ncbi:T9SS type A sorting domain-containing protein [uncultured Psychroserpens sp.]|uniref:T9SS type A sorting domain-containing protein n=1 Tax=uncultured Psychroserpens sp. TaxID=255436 RepID=UPI0026057592|nr:T9SS type A sorting domain-containing protein [uncultured Psychroserpens sp.]